MAKKLEVVITGDTKGLSNAFGEAESRASRFSSKMSSVGSTVSKGIGVGVLGAAGALAVFGPQLVSLGGKLDSWALKVDTVFEGAAGSVRKWADKNNELFGITDEELSGLAASFGDLLKPMGFTAQEAATMSQKVVGLSGALSEWTGGTRSAAEVSDILAKAMLGEREGLKELGISISEADVQSRLAAKGQEKLTGAALAQAKAIATQELIFEKSTDAQKAFAAGGNETIRAGNKLKAIWGEVQVFLAQKLVPVLAKAGGWLADHLPGAVERLRTYFAPIGPMVDKVSDGFARIVERLRPVVAAIGEFIEKNPGPVFAALAVVIGGALTAALWSMAAAVIAAFSPVYLVIAAVALLAAGLTYAYQKVDWFRSAVDAVASFITGTMVPAIQTLWHWFQDNLLPVIQKVAEFYFNAYRAAFLVAVDAAGWLIDKLAVLYEWFTVNILPTLQTVAAWLSDNLAAGWQKNTEYVQALVGKLTTLYDWFSTYLLPILKVVGAWLGEQFVTYLANTRDAIGFVIDKAQTLYDWFKKLLTIANDAGDAIGKVTGVGGSIIGALNPFDGGRAKGGPVLAGRSYLVGERGPEILNMGSTSGSVIPNHALGGGGGGMVVQITIVESKDARTTGREVAAAIARTQRSTGTTGFRVGRSDLVGIG